MSDFKHASFLAFGLVVLPAAAGALPTPDQADAADGAGDVVGSPAPAAASATLDPSDQPGLNQPEPDQFEERDSASLVRDEVIQGRANALVRDERFRFCTDPSYRFWREDKDILCSLRSELTQQCPGLEEACQRPAWEESKPPAWLSSLTVFPHIFRAAGTLATILFWALWAGILATVTWFIVKRLRHLSFDPLKATSTSAPRTRPSVSEPRLSADQYLERAWTSLERGDSRGALHLFYQGLIAGLAEAHLVEAHKSKTSGDYVRSLNDPLQTELRQLTSELDQRRFQPSTPSLEEARRLGSHAQRLRSQALALVALAMIILCVGCSSGGQAIPEVSQAPKGPRGHALFEHLLEGQASSVNKRIRYSGLVDEDTSTVIALSPGLEGDHWRRLRSWVGGGGHLIAIEPDEGFQRAFGLTLHRAPCTEPPVAPELQLLPTGKLWGFEAEPQGEPLLTCGETTIAQMMALDQGWVTLIADESLFQNRSLIGRDNATLAMELVASKDATVEFLGPWTGAGAKHPLQSMFHTGIGLWALHLMIFFGVLAWAGGRRFGTPVAPTSIRRRAFVEHAQALASQYRRARASGLTLSRYADWAWESLRKRAGNGDDTPQSLSRALTGQQSGADQLARALLLARKAAELGGTERDHVSRFEILEKALGVAQRGRLDAKGARGKHI